MAAKTTTATVHTIETDRDVMRGVRALRRSCAYMREAHDRAGDPPLRRNAGGFGGLVRIVVGQQVSVASANAIWGRLNGVVEPLDAATVLRKREATLRKGGLSGPKIRTLRAVAEAVVEGALTLDVPDARCEQIIRDELIGVKGIGPWTADIYLMFCLGRADSWAPGDLALQIAAQKLMGLDERPSPEALSEIAERWRPWRSVAARLLWSFYAVEKSVKGAVPV